MVEPQIQKQRFGHLIPGYDVPNVETHYSEPESSENVHDVEDLLYLKIVEREIYDLIIKEAETEVLKEATDSCQSVIERENVEKHDLGGESGGGAAEGEVENEKNVTGSFGETQQNGYQRWTRFPMRPEAGDCAFYMKTGFCRYGATCRFNHPPRRINQITRDWTKRKDESSRSIAPAKCKYYLTPGGCKHGKACKYSHGLDKNRMSQIQELNFLGLPIRPGERECPHYWRTGMCKYGSTCRFHHPDLSTVTENEVPSAYSYGNGNSLKSSQLVSSSTGFSSWSLPHPQAFSEASPYVSAIYPPNQSSTTNWYGYQAGSHRTSEQNLPLPPAFSVTKPPVFVDVGIQNPHDSSVDEYPQRPGEPECNFFLNTGDCKFKSSCKLHHPKTRSLNPKTLNDKGLPLRPDQPVCMHYRRYGICKYGPICKFDHTSICSASPPAR